ncbi:MAG: hypothetical protein L3J37_07835 [Rhodobacteraceae bacterium]|nr:hypothetical protein [Paracoccaceae bacterium]
MKALRKLEDFGELFKAEQQIVAELDSGEDITIHHDLLSPERDDDYTVRAAFIRYLALGGCDSCRLHEKGLRIKGAHIKDVLDLNGCTLPGDLALFDCRFDSAPVFRSAKMQNLLLNGSYLPQGLKADQLETKGSVSLREVEVKGVVRLVGAKLGGGLECDGAKFNASSGADGQPHGYAFIADGLVVKGGFFLRKGVEINGDISLAGASVAALCDAAECWPSAAESIYIDRFRYGSILGEGVPLDAKTRLEWLAKIKHARGFSPQPYEQLAKVLRETGHREDAREVMIEKERLQRAAQNPPWWRKGWNWLLKVSAGYGHRPSLSIIWLAGLMLFGMLVFILADLAGAVKPGSLLVWQSQAWMGCADAASQKWCYLLSEPGQSYPIFNPFIYSADTLLPIVDLEMQDAWIPDARHGISGIAARTYLWAHIALGWFFSLVAVAGFSGLIKPE